MLKSIENCIFNHAYIDGDWVGAASDFDVLNPATGACIASVADCGADETQQAIAAAERAFPDWRERTAAERGRLLDAWYDLILDHADTLAELLTREQGKPLPEAKGEVLYAASYVKWFAEEGRRIYGDIIPGQMRGTQVLVLKQPVGVCAAITPWNFPYAMVTRKLAPALAAGCTIVLKPAAETPLSALALAGLADKAGFPKGTINIVPGTDSKAIGGALMASPVVRKVSFTGSTGVGKILIRQSAETVKKLTMELGGLAPFIVFDDADIGKAAEGLLASKFRNAGQTCVCANRIYVQSGVYNAFSEAFSNLVKGLKLGNGLEKGVDQGPLISKAAVQKVQAHIDDAVEKGARLLTGGKSEGGLFFQPTVLADTTSEMLVSCEETFGPVAALQSFETEDEVVALANDTVFGLASYVYTQDLGRAFRVVERLESGMVAVNEGILSDVAAPFGGVKQSGHGREGSKYGIDDYTEIKYALFGGLR